MLSPMGRKRRYCNGKKHRTCFIVKLVKRHGAESVCVKFQFEIKEEVVDMLKSYAQHEGNELCGVLTGIKVGDNTFRICKVSPPCVRSHSRCGCQRDAELANQFLTDDYEASEQTRTYIGEWHTHPEQNPHPSQTDYASIIKSFASAQLSVPLLIMIIVGTEHIFFNVYDGGLFKEIEPVIVE